MRAGALFRAGLAFALFVGCRASSTSEQPSAPAPAPAPIEWIEVGRSLEERPIRCARFGTSGETVLLLAGIHGDEAAGVPLLVRLAEELARAPDWSAGRRVLVVPEANPDGLARRTRGNARGVDVNRNFPARNWGPGAPRGAAPLSEPEARALERLLAEEPPARVLSFHQAAELVDYDGPAEALARAVAAASPLPLERMGARPGSLGSYAGNDLGIPVLTIELPRSADSLPAEALWTAYGPMLVEAIRFGANEHAP